MPTITPKEIKITLTKNGQPVAVFDAKSIDVNDDADIVKKKFLGEKRPRISRVENGHSAKIVYEVSDGELEEILKAQIQLADDNQETNVFGIQVQEGYSDGSVKAYALRRACIKLSRSMTENDFTKTLDITAEDYEIIS